MLTNAEIRQVWNGFDKDEQGRADGLTFEQFRSKVRDILNPAKNAKILDDMVQMRMQHTAGIREKRRIDKALEQDKVRI